jgi:hypothetical protein
MPEEKNRILEVGSKGGSNSVVESQPSKLLVAGSIPVSRSSILECRADVAQLVEHSLGKGEVISSILIIGSRFLI